ncbi:MAG: ubiquinol-cytochrome c reductase iron-sulfur subunit [Cumulibacter sp.]
MPGTTDPTVSIIGTKTRRSFMVGTTALAATAALAACTQQGGGPKRDELNPGDLIGNLDQVALGNGKVFPEASVVVTQPSEGEYVALSAICTHQSCTLREVNSGEIYCGCHGSKFDLQGKVLEGPATEDLPSAEIEIKDGKIYAA